jgi:hypothetical protein
MFVLLRVNAKYDRSVRQSMDVTVLSQIVKFSRMEYWARLCDFYNNNKMYQVLHKEWLDIKNLFPCYKLRVISIVKSIKAKAIPVTGRGGLYGCETSRLPHFSRQSPHRWRWGCQALRTGHSEAGNIGSIEKSYGLIGTRNRDFPACSIIPQPTTLLRAPANIFHIVKKDLSRKSVRHK